MTTSKPFAILLSIILASICLGLGFSIYETANTGTNFTDWADEQQ